MKVPNTFDARDLGFSQLILSYEIEEVSPCTT